MYDDDVCVEREREIGFLIHLSFSLYISLYPRTIIHSAISIDHLPLSLSPPRLELSLIAAPVLERVSPESLDAVLLVVAVVAAAVGERHGALADA